MNRIEARVALAAGKKITHDTFNPNQWIQAYKEHHTHYTNEKGKTCLTGNYWALKNGELWDRGWSVKKDSKLSIEEFNKKLSLLSSKSVPLSQ
jgi:hypothetical protein